MKRIVLFLLVCIPFVAVSQTAKEKIIGKWQGADVDGSKTIFIFDKDGYAYMGYGDKLIGGKGYEMNGKKVSLSYTLNITTIPMHLDLIISDLTKDQKTGMPMIFEFLGKDQLKVLGGETNTRPKVFTNEAIVFKRID